MDESRLWNPQIAVRRMFLTGLLLSVGLPAAVGDTAAAVSPDETTAANPSEIRLNTVRDADITTHVALQVIIRGELVTPTGTTTQRLAVSSTANFEFDQRQFASELTGPRSLRCVRRFSEAGTSTIVAADHRTDVALPAGYRLIETYGSDTNLQHLSPDVRLTRQQIDLLQIPFDPLAVPGLLPERNLASQDEKWNTSTWVLPMLTGIDAAVTQSTTCHIDKLTDTMAVIQFEGTLDGAVAGSAADITGQGELTFDRVHHMIVELKAVQKEKRSPGTVSPGLDVTAEIHWTQRLAESADLPEALAEAFPTADRLELTLVTPWRLRLQHNRQWHLFQETADMVMLRMLSNGALVAQCNVTPSATVSAGKFTAEDQFREEVEKSIQERRGEIRESEVTDRPDGWRIHRIRATGKAGEKEIWWDYHLCTVPTGEQFVLVFSHAAEDDEFFGDEDQRILKSLSMPPVRPRIVLPR